LTNAYLEHLNRSHREEVLSDQAFESIEQIHLLA